MAAGSPQNSSLTAPSELRAALEACRSAFIGIGVMSGMINILYLTGSFFMLEVYDRVLPRRSVDLAERFDEGDGAAGVRQMS